MNHTDESVSATKTPISLRDDDSELEDDWTSDDDCEKRDSSNTSESPRSETQTAVKEALWKYRLSPDDAHYHVCGYTDESNGCHGPKIFQPNNGSKCHDDKFLVVLVSPGATMETLKDICCSSIRYKVIVVYSDGDDLRKIYSLNLNCIIEYIRVPISVFFGRIISIANRPDKFSIDYAIQEHGKDTFPCCAPDGCSPVICLHDLDDPVLTFLDDIVNGYLSIVYALDSLTFLVPDFQTKAELKKRFPSANILIDNDEYDDDFFHDCISEGEGDEL